MSLNNILTFEDYKKMNIRQVESVIYRQFIEEDIEREDEVNADRAENHTAAGARKKHCHIEDKSKNRGVWLFIAHKEGKGCGKHQYCGCIIAPSYKEYTAMLKNKIYIDYIMCKHHK